MATATAEVSQPRDYKLIVEKDVQIPLRDGTILYADSSGPDTTEKVPVIMNISVTRKTSCGSRRPTSKKRPIRT